MHRHTHARTYTQRHGTVELVALWHRKHQCESTMESQRGHFQMNLLIEFLLISCPLPSTNSSLHWSHFGNLSPKVCEDINDFSYLHLKRAIYHLVKCACVCQESCELTYIILSNSKDLLCLLVCIWIQNSFPSDIFTSHHIFLLIKFHKCIL